MILFKTNHWPLVLVSLIFLCHCGGSGGTGDSEANAVLGPLVETEWGGHRGNPEQGRLLAMDACSACHVVDGSGKALPGAPPFSETAARNDLTTDFLRRWLKNPLAVKPGTQMPILGLSDRDIEHYIAYLYSLRSQ